MNKDALIKLVNEQMWTKSEADVPSFKAGDTITVTYRIVEGNKERLQSFRGVVIQIKGSGKTKMFTIRKISNGVGVAAGSSGRFFLYPIAIFMTWRSRPTGRSGACRLHTQ